MSVQHVVAGSATAGRDEVVAVMTDQVGRLLASEVSVERLTAIERNDAVLELWDKFAELELPLAMVPEDAGGIGLDIAQGMLLIRLCGYHAAPAPLAETMLSLHLWTRAGGQPISGHVTFASPRAGRLQLEPMGSRLRVHGMLNRVPCSNDGHLLAVVEGREGHAVALLPASALGKVSRKSIANEYRADVTVDLALDEPAQRVLPIDTRTTEDFLQLGALMRSQQMVGAMQRVLDISIAYAQERVQFGRPISKFQAVQHMLASCATEYAAASAAAEQAGDMWGQAGQELAVAVAKARCGEAAGHVAATAHQIHGAIAFTKEYLLHHYTRRLWSWRDEFGNETFWQSRLGNLVCAKGSAALWPLLLGEIAV
ncbi:acyl-CoA dehydrogenase [Bradyrhizobium genosp. SA-3]|uniref:acyl-CoA dehydrogenase family protein n=1 Tax=Bradyrhizobium genosp. SA-3 TaxID=508868 RepID=UPI0010288FBB|nr:acyl-CoA dehydrogenase family protein [Bradyrhizobium genosp. SA-3]RZM96716.1 acyl-CoA dehydrogenase [Bradyrhizobium genosp. SA-3]